MQTRHTDGWLQRSWFKLIIAVCAIVAAGSLFYYFVIRPHNIENCRRPFLIFWHRPIENCDPLGIF